MTEKRKEFDKSPRENILTEGQRVDVTRRESVQWAEERKKRKKVK
jgi:hypothetical protein